jgi:release factor glutamine methyltransferase
VSTPDAAAWNVSRVLSWAAEDFRGRGLETPRLDAELLLSDVLGFNRVKLFLEAERPLSADELSRYRAFIQRRRRGEPIAYILGTREFFGLPFLVDARVLVPRPDTEILVEAALRRTEAQDLHGIALDLCTGSGCVALAFASRRRTWQVYAVDVSSAALEVARSNVERLGLSHVVCLKSDLFAEIDSARRFDLITANPPYIPAGDIATLQIDVRDFEPHLALIGGSDGLDFVRRIIQEAKSRLTADGCLAMEVGHDQAPRTKALFEAAGYTAIEVNTDYGGHQRVVSGALKS